MLVKQIVSCQDQNFEFLGSHNFFVEGYFGGRLPSVFLFIPHYLQLKKSKNSSQLYKINCVNDISNKIKNQTSLIYFKIRIILCYLFSIAACLIYSLLALLGLVVEIFEFTSIDYNITSTMTKRNSQNNISDFEQSGRKLRKDLNSEPIKVQKNEFHQKSQLSYFIKNQKMIQVLQEKGIKRFFPIQYETFEHIFKGKDLIARDRTGSGKTMAFSLPVIERFRKEDAFRDGGKLKYLIVVPTRQLAIQVRTQIHSLRMRGDFEVVAVYGGSDIQEQIRKIRDGSDIIVSTPGRLIDLLERGAIKLSHLQVTCLDQADQMLKQGFQEDIQKIFQFIRKHGPAQKTQNLLFSATIPSWVVELSRTYLSPSKEFIDLIKDSEIRTSKTVEHLALNCPYYHRNSVIADIVNLYGGRHGRTIIFCQTKKQANQIMLKANLKQECQVLHGDIPQKQREVTFQSFKAGQLKCLIATNVAARGLDIPEVDLIVQLEPPKEIDTYIHRSGRTGRAGKSGVCLTFFTKAQQPLLQRIQRLTKIKMKKIGPPQPVDIVRASARDIVLSLKTVEDGVLQYFNDIAEEMISEEGDVKALSKALAFISGNTKKISQRSILCSIQGYITYILRCPTQYQSPGFIFSFLRKNINQQVSESVKGMRRVGKKSAVFDVPEQYKPQMEKLITQCKTENSHIRGYELLVVDSMQMLSDDEDEEKAQNGDEALDFDDREMHNAMKNKRDFQVFIGSLPPNAQERELSDFFKEKKVKITNLRILRNDKGESKCVGFGLCIDRQSVRRALDMDGCRFGAKSLRINLASRK